VLALAGQKVYRDLFDLTDEAEMGHIELSRAADLLVVAPATADLMAKMAQGHANDLASTLLLATDTQVLCAPAMNVRMWEHPATQRNLAQLRADGVRFIGPNEGGMACGEFGPGRMAEPLEIVAAVQGALSAKGFHRAGLPDCADGRDVRLGRDNPHVGTGQDPVCSEHAAGLCRI
jgi:phosphopantothenoylcysteine decarboxylase/phosphopantothenate--cysteine ligase